MLHITCYISPVAHAIYHLLHTPCCIWPVIYRLLHDISHMTCHISLVTRHLACDLSYITYYTTSRMWPVIYHIFSPLFDTNPPALPFLCVLYWGLARLSLAIENGLLGPHFLLPLKTGYWGPTFSYHWKWVTGALLSYHWKRVAGGLARLSFAIKNGLLGPGFLLPLKTDYWGPTFSYHWKRIIGAPLPLTIENGLLGPGFLLLLKTGFWGPTFSYHWKRVAGVMGLSYNIHFPLMG